MSQSVHANPEDLRRLQKAVDTAQAEVSDALKKLQRGSSHPPTGRMQQGMISRPS